MKLHDWETQTGSILIGLVEGHPELSDQTRMAVGIITKYDHEKITITTDDGSVFELGNAHTPRDAKIFYDHWCFPQSKIVTGYINPMEAKDVIKHLKN